MDGARARQELFAELEDRLHRARAIGRGRQLRAHPGVDFSSNDYLGLAARFAVETPSGSIAGSTGSRLLSGQSTAWAELEELLADWHAAGGTARAALCFPSGYVANEGLLSTLLRRSDWVASDEWNHGSLIDGVRLSKAERWVYRHQDLDALESELARVAPDRRRFVVTESVFGMDGDVTDLQRLCAICDRHGALLIVDEAHATGCYGPEGQGRVAELGLGERVLASVHTCGKALGSHGAYVIAPRVVCDFLVQSCRHFIFTTALPPAIAACTRRAVELCRAEPEVRARLHARASELRTALRSAGVPVPPEAASHIVPVLLGADERAAQWSARLQERGLRVPAIRFPTVPRGGARLRISVRADHAEGDVGRLVEGLRTLVGG